MTRGLFKCYVQRSSALFITHRSWFIGFLCKSRTAGRQSRSESETSYLHIGNLCHDLKTIQIVINFELYCLCTEFSIFQGTYRTQLSKVSIVQKSILQRFSTLDNRIIPKLIFILVLEMKFELSCQFE